MSRKKNNKKTKEATIMNENIEEVVEEPVEEVVEDGGDDADETFGYVIPSKLNVRVEPNKEATILMVIDKNKEVIIDGEDGEFLRVVVDGNIGYCMKEFIAIK